MPQTIPERKHITENKYKETQDSSKAVEQETTKHTPKYPNKYTDGLKSIEDWNEYIIIKVENLYTYLLYTSPKINTDCYEPLEPFLGKYSKLYYPPDGIIEDLITCFIDW